MFPVDDILLGPANFGRLHRLDLLIFHTGEEPAFDRKYAVATAGWQLTHPGSYSFRIYDAESVGARGGIMLNVPYLDACGGINPLSAAWAPGRHPFIEAALAKAGKCPKAGCAGPYRNPTMHAGQISFTGRTAQLNAGQEPDNYLVDALRLIAWYETHPLRGPAPLVLVNHGHLQTNRTDAGTVMYGALTRSEEDESMGPRMFVPQPWRTNKDAQVYLSPSTSSEVIAVIPKGNAVVSTHEEAEIRDGKRVTTGPWRTVVLADWRTGFVHRDDIDPVNEGTPEYTAFIRAALFGVDLSDVPSWPIESAQVAQLEGQLHRAMQMVGAIRKAGTAALHAQATGASVLAKDAAAAAENLENL